MSIDQKNEAAKTPDFLQSLGELLDSAKQLAQAVPGAIAELSPMLPKELQTKAPGVLPTMIAITFRKGDDGAWSPLDGKAPAQVGDMVGKYQLTHEGAWGEPAPTA
jgi:hypothetical protein